MEFRLRLINDLKHRLFRVPEFVTLSFQIFLLFTLITWVTPVLALANCGLTISMPNINVVWNQNYNFQTVTFTVAKTKNKACDYGVTFTKGGASDYQRRMIGSSAQLSYQLFKDPSLTQILKDIPDITGPENYFSGSFPMGQNLSQTLTYYFQIPQGLATTPTLKPSGLYSDLFTVNIYEGTTSANFGTPDSVANTTVATTIPKIIDLSLANSGGTFDPAQTSQSLNFGTLTEGQAMGFDLKVRSNAGFNVTFSSQNNGVLKHSNPNIMDTIAYSLSVNSSIKDLSHSQTTPVTTATGSGQTSLSGVTSPVRVSIGQVGSNRMAGQYSDNITVTATTNE